MYTYRVQRRSTQRTSAPKRRLGKTATLPSADGFRMVGGVSIHMKLPRIALIHYHHCATLLWLISVYVILYCSYTSSLLLLLFRYTNLKSTWLSSKFFVNILRRRLRKSQSKRVRWYFIAYAFKTTPTRGHIIRQYTCKTTGFYRVEMACVQF